MKKISINAAALWVAALVMPGLKVSATTSTLFDNQFLKENPWAATVALYLIVGVVFGLVNVLIKPLVKFFSFPINFFTLGLFTFIINAAMLMLTAFFTQFTPAIMQINSFIGTAIPAAIIISIFSVIASKVLEDD